MTAQTIRNFVGGDFVDGGESGCFDKINPVDGRTGALDGQWGGTTVGQRAEALRRVADRIEDRLEDFVLAECADTGKPLRLARDLDVLRAIANFRSFADAVGATGQPSFMTELADGRRALNYAVHKPLGVVAVIVPWNLPLLLLTKKVASALGCGNAVVVKPSEHTPTAAALLMAILGHPLRALHELAALAPRYGLRLRAGQVVLAGAATPAAPLTAAVVEARITGLGSVSVRATP